MKLSNKKLFEIREIKGKHIALGLLIFGAIIGLFTLFICLKGTFATEFHGQSHYKPLNEENKGLYGKVNYCLKKALNEGNTNTPITIENLNALYPRLRFFCSSDSNNYLISSEEVRLIDFIPDNTNNEEVNFFHNSIFKQLIEKQRKNLSKQYFIIKWTSDKRHIVSIEIEPTLGDVPLLNDKWTGEILLDDPFSKIDPNVVYLIKDNIPLPLFSSQLTVPEFRNYETNGHDTIFVGNWKTRSISEYEHMYLNQTDGKPVNVIFRNGQREVRFLNTGNRIYIQPMQLFVQVYLNGKDTLIKEQTTFALPNINNNLKIRVLNIKDDSHLDETLYLSKTPFSIASKLFGNDVGRRVHINSSYADLFSVQQFVHLESNMKAKQQKRVALSTNIFLSKVLENEMRSYVDRLYNNPKTRWNIKDEYQMSVCLMDIATGEIIAAPFYTNNFERNLKDELLECRNYNLENHHIGSTFKPLLAFAAAAKYPALSQFRLTNAHFINKDSCSMLGYTVPPYGLTKKNEPKDIFWTVGNELSRTRFLGHSHDNYPIALTMLALTEPGSRNNNRDINSFNILSQQTLNNQLVNNLHNLLGNNGVRIRNYPRRSIIFNDRARNLNVELGHSSFANLMSNLYNIKTISNDTIVLYSDKYIWKFLDEIPTGLSSLFPDMVNLHWDYVSNFIDFENMVLGQGDNKWNNIKFAEAYSRLLSKRKVQASFVKNSSQSERLFANPSALFNYTAPYIERKTEQEMNNTWSSFMHDWEEAVQQGGDGNTLTPANNRFQINNQNQNYHFYCKTGTPQEEDNIAFNKYLNGRVDDRGNVLPVWYDEGVFVFGITSNNTQNPRGVVGVVYIKHISETSPPEGIKGVESYTARDFFTSELYKKVMFYNHNRFNQ